MWGRRGLRAGDASPPHPDHLFVSKRICRAARFPPRRSRRRRGRGRRREPADFPATHPSCSSCSSWFIRVPCGWRGEMKSMRRAGRLRKASPGQGRPRSFGLRGGFSCSLRRSSRWNHDDAPEFWTCPSAGESCILAANAPNTPHWPGRLASAARRVVFRKQVSPGGRNHSCHP